MSHTSPPPLFSSPVLPRLISALPPLAPRRRRLLFLVACTTSMTTPLQNGGRRGSKITLDRMSQAFRISRCLQSCGYALCPVGGFRCTAVEVALCSWKAHKAQRKEKAFIFTSSSVRVFFGGESAGERSKLSLRLPPSPLYRSNKLSRGREFVRSFAGVARKGEAVPTPQSRAAFLTWLGRRVSNVSGWHPWLFLWRLLRWARRKGPT